MSHVAAVAAIPARLAQAARTSSNVAEARERVLTHYRDWYRAAPQIIDLYGLNVSPHFIRLRMRAKFEEHRHVHDPRTIDMLLHKGRLELQETLNQWKMPDQLLGVMLQERARPPRTFMQKFLEGRDGDASLPAASGLIQGR